MLLLQQCKITAFTGYSSIQWMLTRQIQKITMQKIVLFKSDSEEYRRACNGEEYEAIFVEPLQFRLSAGAGVRAKAARGDYAGLVLTSPRAVDALAQCWDSDNFVLWNTKKIYAVGETTSHRSKLLLGLDTMGMSAGNAEKLAEIIAKENSDGSRFLFPCGNLSSEILPQSLQAKGILLDCVTVYETHENDNLQESLMRVNEEQPCALVFFSPSGCEYVHQQLQTFSNKLSLLPHFAIGHSTAKKIQNLGIELAGVAEKPKAENVMQTIKKYFNTSSSN